MTRRSSYHSTTLALTESVFGLGVGFCGGIVLANTPTMPADKFGYDVFLIHSPKDKNVVQGVAERLRADGLHVCFDRWEIKPKDSAPAKIVEELERSRVLVLCMSADGFGSEWTQLESSTFRFRDPLNKERRFIPLRLDDAPIKGSLAQFLHARWRPEDREQEYSRLLEACRPKSQTADLADDPFAMSGTLIVREPFAEKALHLNCSTTVYAYAFSSDGKRVFTNVGGKIEQLWDIDTGLCLRGLEGTRTTLGVRQGMLSKITLTLEQISRPNGQRKQK